MGITPAALKIINDMAQKSLFDNRPLRIIELGSQEIHSNESVLVDNLYETFGVSRERRQHIAFGEKGRTLFENLGFIYECIDLDGLEQTRAWDINTVQCPEPFREQYVLTTNHGTTEHLIGQDNAFRLLHDLTAVGGFMMHTVPCTGQVNHGFFSYSPIFFFSLARANAYTISYFYVTNFNDLYQYQHANLPAFSYIITVLQKTEPKPYQSPLQIWDRANLRYVDEARVP